MFADAVREIRFHPGRFVATLVAIAISVGFLAAVSIFMTSQINALSTQSQLPVSAADLVISSLPDEEPTTADEQQVPLTAAKVQAIDGVAAAETVQQDTAVLTHNNVRVYVSLQGVPSAPFQWTQPVEGRWPTKKGEIVLSQGSLKKLGLAVGDTLDQDGDPTTVVGVTNDPESLFGAYAYGPRGTEFTWNLMLVKLKPGADPQATITALNKELKPYALRAQTRQDFVDESFKDLTAGINVLQYILQGFGGVALVVGVITITNTFNILVVQRRRQIGLLRAVGASGPQIRQRLLIEAMVVGFLGSGLGLLFATALSALGLWATQSWWAGLKFPARDLTIAVLVGVIATVVAAVVPASRATRVAPLEALQPVPTSEAARRASRIRLVIVGILAAVGVGAAIMALTYRKDNFYWAATADVALAIGSLVGAVFLVTGITKLVGLVLTRFGATPRLAVLNALRNPRRTAATSGALMLAVGLIVMLQVVLSTLRTSALNAVDEAFPVDLSLSYAVNANPDAQRTGQLPDDLINKARKFTGLETLVVMQGAVIEGGANLPAESAPWAGFNVLVPNPEAAKVSAAAPTSVPDDTVLVPDGLTENKTITLPTTDGGTVSLKVKVDAALEWPSLMVSAATLATMSPNTVPLVLWMKLKPGADVATIYSEMGAIPEVAGGAVTPGGAAIVRFVIVRVIDVLVIALTALVGVAVLVSLVGVANTLGLSILERMRESALLRAMGMQRSSLRAMLLIEALMITLVGVIVGVVGGAFLAWLAVSGLFKQFGQGVASFSINWQLTGALILVTAVAAALASIIPGRKAALAPPTEALAAE